MPQQAQEQLEAAQRELEKVAEELAEARGRVKEAKQLLQRALLRDREITDRALRVAKEAINLARHR